MAKPARPCCRTLGRISVQLADPYGSVPLARYVALFEAAALLSREPTLGLRLGRELCPTTLGPMGVLAVHQPTLRQHSLHADLSGDPAGRHPA